MTLIPNLDESSAGGWPVATLDPVRRVHALAAAIPSAEVQETHFDRSFDEVWSFIADLEWSVSRFDDLVAKLTIDTREWDDALAGERIVARAWTTKRTPPMTFDVELCEGFCLMQARHRLFLVAMAAAPDPAGGTRFAHVEALPRRFSRVLRPIYRRTARSDLRGMHRALS